MAKRQVPARIQQIRKLWDEHVRTPFPDLLMFEVAGEDLLLLDSYAAGCISTFIDRRGTLDRKRRDVLGRCREGIARAIPSLRRSAKTYFVRLHRLAELIEVELGR